MQEFKRYKELIKRESMKRELVAEREVLLSELNAFIQNIGNLCFKRGFITAQHITAGQRPLFITLRHSAFS